MSSSKSQPTICWFPPFWRGGTALALLRWHRAWHLAGRPYPWRCWIGWRGPQFWVQVAGRQGSWEPEHGPLSEWRGSRGRLCSRCTSAAECALGLWALPLVHEGPAADLVFLICAQYLLGDAQPLLPPTLAFPSAHESPQASLRPIFKLQAPKSQISFRSFWSQN